MKTAGNGSALLDLLRGTGQAREHAAGAHQVDRTTAGDAEAAFPSLMEAAVDRLEAQTAEPGQGERPVVPSPGREGIGAGAEKVAPQALLSGSASERRPAVPSVLPEVDDRPATFEHARGAERGKRKAQGTGEGGSRRARRSEAGGSSAGGAPDSHTAEASVEKLQGVVSDDAAWNTAETADEAPATESLDPAAVTLGAGQTEQPAASAASRPDALADEPADDLEGTFVPASHVVAQPAGVDAPRANPHPEAAPPAPARETFEDPALDVIGMESALEMPVTVDAAELSLEGGRRGTVESSVAASADAAELPAPAVEDDEIAAPASVADPVVAGSSVEPGVRVERETAAPVREAAAAHHVRGGVDVATAIARLVGTVGERPAASRVARAEVPNANASTDEQVAAPATIAPDDASVEPRSTTFVPVALDAPAAGPSWTDGQTPRRHLSGGTSWQAHGSLPVAREEHRAHPVVAPAARDGAATAQDAASGSQAAGTAVRPTEFGAAAGASTGDGGDGNDRAGRQSLKDAAGQVPAGPGHTAVEREQRTTQVIGRDDVAARQQRAAEIAVVVPKAAPAQPVTEQRPNRAVSTPAFATTERAATRAVPEGEPAALPTAAASRDVVAPAADGPVLAPSSGVSPRNHVHVTTAPEGVRLREQPAASGAFSAPARDAFVRPGHTPIQDAAESRHTPVAVPTTEAAPVLSAPLPVPAKAAPHTALHAHVRAPRATDDLPAVTGRVPAAPGAAAEAPAMPSEGETPPAVAAPFPTATAVTFTAPEAPRRTPLPDNPTKPARPQFDAAAVRAPRAPETNDAGSRAPVSPLAAPVVSPVVPRAPLRSVVAAPVPTTPRAPATGASIDRHAAGASIDARSDVPKRTAAPTVSATATTPPPVHTSAERARVTVSAAPDHVQTPSPPAAAAQQSMAAHPSATPHAPQPNRPPEPRLPVGPAPVAPAPQQILTPPRVTHAAPAPRPGSGEAPVPPTAVAAPPSGQPLVDAPRAVIAAQPRPGARTAVVPTPAPASVTPVAAPIDPQPSRVVAPVSSAPAASAASAPQPPVLPALSSAVAVVGPAAPSSVKQSRTPARAPAHPMSPAPAPMSEPVPVSAFAAHHPVQAADPSRPRAEEIVTPARAVAPEPRRVRAAVLELQHRGPGVSDVATAASRSGFDTAPVADKGRALKKFSPPRSGEVGPPVATDAAVIAPAMAAAAPTTSDGASSSVAETERTRPAATRSRARGGAVASERTDATATSDAPLRQTPPLPILPAATTSSVAASAPAAPLREGGIAPSPAPAAVTRERNAGAIEPASASPERPRDASTRSAEAQTIPAPARPRSTVEPMHTAAAGAAPAVRTDGVAPAFVPLPAAASPLLELAAEDPTLHAAALGKTAHLRLDTGGNGELALHMLVKDGVVDLRVDGAAAQTLDLRPQEVRTALAGEGISLGRFEAGSASSGSSSTAQQGGGRDGAADQQAQRAAAAQAPAEPGARDRAFAREAASAQTAGSQTGSPGTWGGNARQFGGQDDGRWMERERATSGRPGSAPASTPSTGSSGTTTETRPRRGVHVTA